MAGRESVPEDQNISIIIITNVVPARPVSGGRAGKDVTWGIHRQDTLPSSSLQLQDVKETPTHHHHFWECDAWQAVAGLTMLSADTFCS